MNELKLILFIGLMIPLVLAKVEYQTVYSVDLEVFRDHEVMLRDISVRKGTVSTYPTREMDYSVKVVGNGDVLFERNLDISFLLNLEPITSVELDSTRVNLRVPYFEEAERISIYHLDEEIFSVELSDEVCDNNSLCEEGENTYNCPRDCVREKEISLFLFILLVIIVTGVGLVLSKKIFK